MFNPILEFPIKEKKIKRKIYYLTVLCFFLQKTFFFINFQKKRIEINFFERKFKKGSKKFKKNFSISVFFLFIFSKFEKVKTSKLFFFDLLIFLSIFLYKGFLKKLFIKYTYKSVLKISLLTYFFLSNIIFIIISLYFLFLEIKK